MLYDVKAQSTNFLFVLAAGFFALVAVWGFMGGLQGAIASVFAVSGVPAETRFLVVLLPFMVVFSVIFWIVMGVKGGGGA